MSVVEEAVASPLGGTVTKPAMADAGAWAVLAFSTTSFMLGLYNAHIVDANGAALVVPVAFVFGGLIQILVAILEVVGGNLFGAVVFGTFGPFWVIYGWIQDKYAAKVITAGTAAHDPKALTSGLALIGIADGLKPAGTPSPGIGIQAIGLQAEPVLVVWFDCVVAATPDDEPLATLFACVAAAPPEDVPLAGALTPGLPVVA